VNNGSRTNYRRLTGVVVGVQPGREGGGTIQFRPRHSHRNNLPVINGQHRGRSGQDVMLHVSDDTRFRTRGQHRKIDLGDVRQGETIRVRLDDNRYVLEVEVLSTSSNGHTNARRFRPGA
jgi:hypothetical protein